MRFKSILAAVLILVLSVTFTPIAQAQSPVAPPQYLRGRIIQIAEENRVETKDGLFFTQKLVVQLKDSAETHAIDIGSEYQPLSAQQKLSIGQEVIIGEQINADGQKEYVLADVYRLPTLLYLALFFVFLVLVIARSQGATALIAMSASFIILLGFVIPQILAGQNPIVISLIGSVTTAAISQYLSHGWSLRSHLAFGSIIVTLICVGLLSYIAVHTGQLLGLGSEEAAYLLFGTNAKINLQGLLLAGIMLGTLGVLDDVIVAQISVVEQLKEAKPHIGLGELISRSLVVGKDHVSSLVNTLVLAYACSSLPLFLLFTINASQQPWWMILNSQIVAEEVVRTLVGSIGLVLGVPLSSILAAVVLSRRKSRAT